MGRFLATAATIVLCAPAAAQSDPAAFYAGRQMTIIVASTPGGGYDTYARLVARHMPRHIPGDPRMIVSNMSGAGGNMAASYIVNALPQDGAAMALVLPPTIMGGLYESVDKLKYDPAKLVHIGSANSEIDMCFVRADSGIASIADAREKSIILGGSAEGSVTRTQPAILNNLIGTKFRVVGGYPGTRQIFLAMESGEVQGVCGLSYSGMLLQKPDWLANGFARMLVQGHMKGSAQVNKLGVPVAAQFARNEADLRAMELIFAQQDFGRPFVAAPGVPSERVAVLRKAFMAAMRDEALLKEAAAQKLDIDPLAGEELQALAAKLYTAPNSVIERAKDAQIYRAP